MAQYLISEISFSLGARKIPGHTWGIYLKKLLYLDIQVVPFLDRIAVLLVKLSSKRYIVCLIWTNTWKVMATRNK